MWNKNGYGWVKPVTNQNRLDDGYTMWQIVPKINGQYDVKISNFGMTEIYASGVETLDIAKDLVSEAESDKGNIWGGALIGLAVVGIVTTLIIGLWG